MRLSFVAIAVVLTSSLSFANHGGHHHGGGGHAYPNSNHWGNNHFGGGHAVHHGAKPVHEPSTPKPATHQDAPKAKSDAPDAQTRSKKPIDPAQLQFMQDTDFPDGRPGYVITYIVPLKKGGLDSPSNMQWKEKETPKPKDLEVATPLLLPSTPLLPPSMPLVQDRPRHHRKNPPPG